ncbi:MAG: C25 family cysteine peptidase [Caldilineales bacterium]|nr:C25 family cysteine peptidase [Caldilineales bacterium]MDW8318487.1 C25 family cysteine peptidase [Anaerolineae bacterium]
MRVGVSSDGLVRITPADLSAAGVNLSAVDPRTFAMTSLGQPVAIRVVGEADGRFDPGDEIQFFGQRFRGPEMEQKYTDERVYWLDIGGNTGPRIADVSATPVGDRTPPADFLTTLRAEQNMIWWTLHTLYLDTQDTWYWERLQTGGGPGDSVTRSLSYTVPHPAPGYPATLRLEEVSRYNSGYTNFYHRTGIALNGVNLGTFDWQGRVRQVFQATVPAGTLVHGTNTVAVTATNVSGTTYDDIYVNYWEVDYRRQFIAWNGQLDFTVETSGVQEFLVSGWSSPAVAIWDVTDPLQPRRLTGASVQPEGSGYRVRFRVDAAAGARFWLQEEATWTPPTSVRVRPPTGLRNPTGGADAVIVTHASLRPAAELLANWHRSYGRRALVVDARDAYDEFNDGIYHPKAISAMLAWAHAHWAPPGPQYLTLVGDGHWNFKGYNTAVYPAPPIMIPPFLAFVDPWQGEVPADTLYGNIAGNDVPEISVGRLAVNTLDEAYVAVNKIIAYDQTMRTQPWQRRALFVADNADSAGDFAGLTDQIISTYLPSDVTPTRVYLGVTHATASDAKAAIRNAINAGTWMVQFSGHGAPERWTHEFIWTKDDVPSLVNNGMFPVVMTFNCLDGYFAHTDPARVSIAETMQRLAGGGSVAAISPSGLGLTSDQHTLRKVLMEAIFFDGIREVGTALTVAKQRYAATYGVVYLNYTQMLFGDPAMRLPWANVAVPKSPAVAISRSGSAAVLTWPAVTQDVYHQPTSVTGYHVWRGDSPYFDPLRPNCNCRRIATTSTPGFTDTGSVGAITPIGDPTTNYFYVVQAANSVGHSAVSNRVGEFDFLLVR